jgi:hypothetical protein
MVMGSFIRKKNKTWRLIPCHENIRKKVPYFLILTNVKLVSKVCQEWLANAKVAQIIQ